MEPRLTGMVPLLLVRDMKVSVDFYKRALGFSVVASSAPAYASGWALLARSGIELMLNGASDQSKIPPAHPDRTAAHADTTLYFGCSDLDSAFLHFRKQGIELAPPVVTGYGFRSLELRDPDGYTLVLHWPETEEARLDWRDRYEMQFPELPG